MLNFTWWVPQGRGGNNLFSGGFLGLDNIGVFSTVPSHSDRWLPSAGRWHGLDGFLIA